MLLYADQTQSHQFFKRVLYFDDRVPDARFQQPPLDDAFQRVFRAWMIA